MHFFSDMKSTKVRIVGRQGIVQHVFNGQFAADRHVREAIDAVRSLSSAAT